MPNSFDSLSVWDTLPPFHWFHLFQVLFIFLYGILSSLKEDSVINTFLVQESIFSLEMVDDIFAKNDHHLVLNKI